MKIIKPYHAIDDSSPADIMLRRIEVAGRTCYKSEDRITDESAPRFIRSIIERGHESVLEHEKMTVRIVCDRGVTHEIVRHRLASYSQESTRYCNYKGGVTFILPPWVVLPDGMELGQEYEGSYISAQPITTAPDERTAEASGEWIALMAEAEETYTRLINVWGWNPQEARSVLPNSLKTEIVMTCNLREWRHFFKLRTAKAAHPQMREIAVPMLREFQQYLPVVFDDIEPFEG